ncbi:MAG: adenylate/guanylate cyclase domain-containing protein [Pseudomonadota bacterium]
MSQQQIAVLFADLSGSTAIYEQLGDAAAKRQVDACLMQLARSASGHQGLVVKTIGDELMLRFPSADQAAAAAIAMQLDNAKAKSLFRLRIGFHFGPVILDASDVFGDAVNTAARLAQMSHDGQILTSEETSLRFNHKHQGMTRNFDYDKLRGKSQAMRILEIMWEPTHEVTRAIGGTRDASFTQPKAHARLLRLSVGDKERAFTEQDVPVTIGRESVCTLVVASQFASRVHTHVEYRRDKFVLQDRSTNGTFVTADGGQEVFLKGESLPLSGHGIISLGCPLLAQTGEILRYAVE